MATVTRAALRRYVVAHQGYTSRVRSAKPAEVAHEIARLGAVQLDSIATVDRAHRITLSTRIGGYDEKAVSALLTRGEIFEYWAHEACLLPIQDYPLFKRRMEHLANEHWWGRKRQARDVEENIEPHGGHVPILAGFEG